MLTTQATRTNYRNGGSAEPQVTPNFLCDFGGRRLSLGEVDQDANSAALLREFAESRSETAFGRLVRQHLNLVYSAALRRCGGRTGLAQDVCQTVFIDLARKARHLPRDIVLAGWLYQRACFVAATMLRAENRRQEREEIARQNLAMTDDLDWTRLAPLLDDALLELAPIDRDSLVLRYLQQCPLAEVGARLGLSENAARMRVDRALDKLRVTLAKRGVTSTSTALAVALTGPAITAAPATLASTATAAALAATVTTASTLGILSLMATTKLKLAVAAAALFGVGLPLALQQRAAGRLREENVRLRQQLTLAEADAQSARTAARPVADELARLREGQAELLRLRGELARRRRTEPAANASVATRKPTSAADQFAAASWNTQATVGFQQALVTGAWAWKDQAAVLVVRPIRGTEPGQPSFQLESTIVTAPLELLQRHGLAGDSDASQAWSEEATTQLLAALRQEGAKLSQTEPTTPGEEGFVLVGFTEDDHDQTMSFKLAPERLADQSLNLAISAERRLLSPLEQQILREPDAGVRQELIKRRDAGRNSAGG